MGRSHEHRSRRVSEPVQVYLGQTDRNRLERLASELDATKSDVLRRGLEALEQQLADPASHPAIGLIGLGGNYARNRSLRGGSAADHDQYLVEQEIASWRRTTGRKRAR